MLKKVTDQSKSVSEIGIVGKRQNGMLVITLFFEDGQKLTGMRLYGTLTKNSLAVTPSTSRFCLLKVFRVFSISLLRFPGAAKRHIVAFIHMIMNKLSG